MVLFTLLLGEVLTFSLVVVVLVVDSTPERITWEPMNLFNKSRASTSSAVSPSLYSSVFILLITSLTPDTLDLLVRNVSPETFFDDDVVRTVTLSHSLSAEIYITKYGFGIYFLSNLRLFFIICKYIPGDQIEFIRLN